MAALNIPNPHDTPDPWDTLKFDGAEVDHTWPPETNEETKQYGLVEWGEFEIKAKIDKKVKAGAAKPKVTTTGGEAVAFSFVIVVVQTSAAIDAVAPILDTLRPGAGPFGLKRHPWAALAKIDDFIVESVKLSPPSDGQLRISVSCIQVDKDAQANKGGNVSSTPASEKDAEKRAIDKWTARRDAAANYEKAEQVRRIVAEHEAAKATFDATSVRTAKKLWSVLSGENEVDITTAQPTTPSTTNVATGRAS
jgi:hypothetical protein